MIETSVYLLTKGWLSLRTLKSLCFYSLSKLGNLRYISVSAITKLTFMPLSAFEWSRSKISEQLSLHILDDTHMILQRATVAFLSNTQVNGSTYCLALFLASALLHISMICGRNGVMQLSWISLFSVMLIIISLYCSTSASFPPVIWANS